jgi:hypothetical protein
MIAYQHGCKGWEGAQTQAGHRLLDSISALHACCHCCVCVAGPGQGARTAFEDAHQLMLALKQHWPDTAAVAEQFEARSPCGTSADTQQMHVAPVDTLPNVARQAQSVYTIVAWAWATHALVEAPRGASIAEPASLSAHVLVAAAASSAKGTIHVVLSVLDI